MKRFLRYSYNTRCYTSSNTNDTLRVCVVGSGPAGFYTSKYLLNQFSKIGKKVHVSMLERLPTPYGLVRYGVAPDHPEVKAVTNDFESVASQKEKFSFFGNVSVGKDVSVSELKQLFHAIVLCYGAEGERKLKIDGEEKFDGIESAREFVNWYNGLPDIKTNQSNAWFQKATQKYTKLLQTSKQVVIIGQGNVAIDVARILAKPSQELSKYDTTDYALQTLQNHSVQEILVIGRRGPVQAACTTKELRELTKIEGCNFTIESSELVIDTISSLDLEKSGRVKKRLLEVMQQAASSPIKYPDGRNIRLLFYRNPVAFIGDNNGRLRTVRFEKTKLVGQADSIKAVGTGQFEEIDCQLVFRSIGYKSYSLSGVPFDSVKAIVPNILGRVVDDGAHVKGLYVCGWLKRGPVGVILSNVLDAQETVQCIMQDYLHEMLESKEGEVGLKNLCELRNVDFINFEQYKKLDMHEVQLGKQKGKLRDKVQFIEDMLDIAKK